MTQYTAMAHLLQYVKNSTSLTAKEKVLLYLYISILLVLKLTLLLTFLRPARSTPSGTEATPAYGMPEGSASQISKSSGTA
jgi:hypothetical protein